MTREIDDNGVNKVQDGTVDADALATLTKPIGVDQTATYWTELK